MPYAKDREAPKPFKDDVRKAPMWVLRVADVFKLDTIEKHEVIKGRGLLVEHDGSTDDILFCSHTWLGGRHPDPDGVKMALLKSILADICAGKRPILTHYFNKISFGNMDIKAAKLQKDLANGFVWLDYWSVPQDDASSQQASIDSIDHYVARSAYFCVLAGAWKHEDGSVRDQRAWSGRGWCRLEVLANALSPRSKPLIVAQSRSAIVTHGPLGLPSRKWVELPVCEGTFTVDSDRAKLRPTIEKLIARRTAQALRENDMVWYRWLVSMRERLLDGAPSDARGWLASMRERLLDGAPSDAPPSKGPKLDAWLTEMRLSSVHDTKGTGVPPLLYAALRGDVELVRAVLDAGADINAPCARKINAFGIQKGQTALDQAALVRNNPQVVELLLERGANQMLRSGEAGMVCFGWALAAGHVGNLDALLKHAPPQLLRQQIGDFGDFSPMTFSVFGGRAHVFEWMMAKHKALGTPEEVAKWLGPPSLSGDAFGISLATHVVNQVGDLETLKAVVRAGGDIHGATICRGGNKTVRTIFLLSDLACLLSHPTPFFEFWSYSCRCTPLHAAVYNANLPAVVSLLEMGADVDSRRHRFKLTPLQLAAQGGHDAIAQHLLGAGAQRGLRDAKGRTAARWAAMRGHAALHALLADAPVPPVKPVQQVL